MNRECETCSNYKRKAYRCKGATGWLAKKDHGGLFFLNGWTATNYEWHPATLDELAVRFGDDRVWAQLRKNGDIFLWWESNPTPDSLAWYLNGRRLLNDLGIPIIPEDQYNSLVNERMKEEET